MSKFIKLPDGRIQLTAEDRKYAPVPRLASILSEQQHVTRSMPTIEQEPDLWHVCPTCGVFPPKWLMRKWRKCSSCPCSVQKREEDERREKEQAWLNWQRANCYGGWLGAAHKDREVISQMTGKTFESYITSRSDENFATAQSFAQTKRPNGNIIFTGSYGTGKTHVGSAILNYRREHWKNSTLFASAPQFFSAYEEAKRSFDQTQFLSIRQRIIQADFVYVDDIDKEWRGDWKQPELHSIYYYIFDERYKARRSTIVSTNDMDQMEKYIGAAAKSRLMSHCTVVNMFGEDFRAVEEW